MSNKPEKEKTYRAPALVKGLEILELLGREALPLNLSSISERLSRSRGEIFRMVRALEDTGYILKSMQGDGYEISSKMFHLGLAHPPTVTLMEAALPLMREFSLANVQSCHLAIATGGEITVITRIQSGGPVSFSVRVGHRQLISKSTSGSILYAWQSPDVQKEWQKLIKKADRNFDKSAFIEIAKDCREQGYLCRDSRFIAGVVDVSAPILRGGIAIAALTSPILKRLDERNEHGVPVDQLVETAKLISSKVSPIV